MPPGLRPDHDSTSAKCCGPSDVDKMQGHPLPGRRLHGNLPRGASVLQSGRTSPAPLPKAGQIAPNMQADVGR
jgi:hypothetical protein